MSCRALAMGEAKIEVILWQEMTRGTAKTGDNFLCFLLRCVLMSLNLCRQNQTTHIPSSVFDSVHFTMFHSIIEETLFTQYRWFSKKIMSIFCFNFTTPILLERFISL